MNSQLSADAACFVPSEFIPDSNYTVEGNVGTDRYYTYGYSPGLKIDMTGGLQNYIPYQYVNPMNPYIPWVMGHQQVQYQMQMPYRGRGTTIRTRQHDPRGAQHQERQRWPNNSQKFRNDSAAGQSNTAAHFSTAIQSSAVAQSSRSAQSRAVAQSNESNQSVVAAPLPLSGSTFQSNAVAQSDQSRLEDPSSASNRTDSKEPITVFQPRQAVGGDESLPMAASVDPSILIPKSKKKKKKKKILKEYSSETTLPVPDHSQTMPSNDNSQFKCIEQSNKLSGESIETEARKADSFAQTADSSENLAGMSRETTEVKDFESGSRALESNKPSDLMPLSILKGSYSAVVKSGSLKTNSMNLTECSKQTNTMSFRSNSTTRNSQEANTKKNRSLSRSGNKRSDSLGQPQNAPKRAVKKPTSCEDSSGLQKISVPSERNTNNVVREKLIRTPSGGRNIETSSPQKYSSIKLLSKPQPGGSDVPKQCVNRDPVQSEPGDTADNESNKRRRKKKSIKDVASPQLESETEFPGLPQADPELSTSTSLFRYSDVLKRQVTPSRQGIQSLSSTQDDTNQATSRQVAKPTNSKEVKTNVAKVNLKLSPAVDKVQTKSKSPKEPHSKVLPSPQPKGQLRSRSQPATQKPSTKLSKLPITLNIADMITKTKTKKVQENTHNPSRNSLIPSQKKPLKGANTLDSSIPMKKRGKEREVPKAKKLSSMRKVILKERMSRRTKFLQDCGLLRTQSLQDLSTTSGNLCDSDTESQLPLPTTSVECDVGCPAQKESDESLLAKIHSRRFREYCSQVLNKDIDSCCTLLLQELVRFQDRLYHKDPTKAKIRRRLVMGLREVTKHLKVKKLKCIIISPNLEKIQSKGGLDEMLNQIIVLCQEQNVPFVFALNRITLGKVCAKHVPVSVVGIFNYDGAEEHYHKLKSLTNDAREKYAEMITKFEEEVKMACQGSEEEMTMACQGSEEGVVHSRDSSTGSSSSSADSRTSRTCSNASVCCAGNTSVPIHTNENISNFDLIDHSSVGTSLVCDNGNEDIVINERSHIAESSNVTRSQLPVHENISSVEKSSDIEPLISTERSGEPSIGDGLQDNISLSDVIVDCESLPPSEKCADMD